MAEIIASEKPQGGKVSAKRNLVRIDMTPMVDLGFLLITFFMFTTSFLKPNIMDLGLPAKGPIDGDVPVIDYRNQITFILGKNDKIFYYQKELKDLSASDIKETSSQGISIARLIDSYKKVAPKPENFTIIIKPTDEANYKNFVDILDDMAISKNERYGIADLKPSEKKLYEEITN